MEENFENNIGFLLHDVTRLMKRLFDKRMSTLDLTRSQWWVLNFLYFNEGINQSDFAVLLDIEKLKDANREMKYTNGGTH